MTRTLRHRRKVIMAAALGLHALVLGAASGAPGVLDTTFGGSDGKVLLDHHNQDDTASSVAIRPDGKIVVGGTGVNSGNNDFVVARYDPDGTPDLDFDTDGVTDASVGGSTDDLQGLALQDDGKIVAVGSSFFFRWSLGVVRLLADGSPDPEFGDGPNEGWVLLQPGSIAFGRDVAVAPDGSIVAVGFSSEGGPTTFAVGRLTPEGDADLTFDDETGTDTDDDGVVLTDLGDGTDEAHSMVIQPDGKIVVAGTAIDGGQNRVGVVRYNTDGTLDASFSSDGRVMTPAEDGTTLLFNKVDVAQQPDGNIVVAATTQSSDGDYDLALFRYNPDGDLDDSFGGDGRLTIAVTTNDDAAAAITATDDDRLIVVGYTYNGSNDDFLVTRLRADGSLDPSFGSGGSVITPFGDGTDDPSDVAIQADGKIVAVGTSEAEGPETEFWFQFAIARYEARAARSASLTSSSSAPVFGRSFTLSGKTTSTDPLCRAGVEVQISRDVLGGAVSFVPIATRTTANDGTFTLTRKADRSAAYRVSAPANDGCDAALASRTVKVKKKVALEASASRVPVGSPVKLKASVAPCRGHSGDKVILQKKTSSGFKKVASKATNRRCVAIFRVTMKRTTVFRAVAPKSDSDHLAGKSPTRRVEAV